MSNPDDNFHETVLTGPPLLTKKPALPQAFMGGLYGEQHACFLRKVGVLGLEMRATSFSLDRSILCHQAALLGPSHTFSLMWSYTSRSLIQVLPLAVELHDDAVIQ
jgi:hypothetical protein